jgi:CRISPR-associated protein (TIGR03986 family)
MSKGTIASFNENRGFGFIRREGESDLFFHISQWRGAGDPVEGQEVDFTEGQGRQGKSAAQNVTPAGKSDLKEKHFLNPYNFVRFLPAAERSPDDPVDVQLMGRTMPPPHDRWVGLTGKISCRITTITPLFISGSENVTSEKIGGKTHFTYSFFRIGDDKAIPASSIRGSIRSVFEAATNSCFANLGGERLSYRLPGRDVQKLVPAIVIKEPGEGETGWALQLLTGVAPFEPEVGQKNGLYAAPVRFYKALKSTGRQRSKPPDPIGNPDHWQHGEKYYAVLRKVKFPPSWRVVDLFADDRRRAADDRLAQLKREQPHNQYMVQEGRLCKTFQNTDNKNSERFFFKDPARSDVPETISLPKSIRDKYEDLIKDYQVRHADAVAKRAHPEQVEKGEIAFSRFVLKKEEARLKGGELVYVRLRGRSPNLQVKFIAPVAWPRVAYDNKIGDLLPDHLRRCDSLENLCPACRTFGWVHGQNEEGAYRGRVRFTHAKMQHEGEKISAQTLAILGSPKPTTTRFYLAGPDGKPSKKAQDDNTVGYDGNGGHNRLRGRKFYRHHIPDPANSTLTPQQQDKANNWDQNRTIKDPEGKGAVFSFSIDFENLAPVELGALLWSLELGGKGYHRLGFAKPLGLGSVAIDIQSVLLEDIPGYYTSLQSDGRQQVLSADDQEELVARFQEAMLRPYASQNILAYAGKRGRAGWQEVFEQLPNIQDLLALLNRNEPDLPVHYPKSPDPNSKGQFEWFVGNNRVNGPRIELSLATADEGLPYIRKDGTLA